MMVMSPSPMNAPSIVSPSSMVRQITSATGQEEQVDFMVSLGCENGGLEHLHFPPKAHLHSGLTTPRKHPSTHSENGRAGFRSCMNILDLGKRTSRQLLERACERLVESDPNRQISYTGVKNTIAAIRTEDTAR